MSIKSKLRKLVGAGGGKRRIRRRMNRYVKRSASGRFLKRGR